jgi:hypothetical protein
MKTKTERLNVLKLYHVARVGRQQEGERSCQPFVMPSVQGRNPS